MFMIIFILLFVPLSYTQRQFDSYIETYDSFIRLWIFGYENQGNRGFLRGCCFRRNGTVCTPCRYKVVWRARQYDANTLIEDNMFYDIGVYSQAAESLFETFYFEKLYSWLYINDHDVNFYNAETQSSAVVETMDKYSYSWYGNYEFDGAYGVFNRMRSWIVMSLTKYGYFQTNQVNLVLQTIAFDKYKLTSGECCAETLVDEDKEECPIPCSFYVSLTTGNYDYAKSRDIDPLRRLSRVYTYNMTFGFYSSYLSFYDKTLRIKFNEKKNKGDIDMIELRNLNLLRKRTYYFNNVAGIHGNMRANISLSLYCIGTGGVLCARQCSEFRGVDNCDNEIGVPLCLNGASDIRKCENTTFTCENNPCLNNGTCKVTNNNRRYCVCEKGFSGEYCEDIICDKNCNQRGICVAPNKCICQHPFFGDTCEKQQCNSTISSICLNGGLCYYDNIEPKCNCLDDRFNGKYCEIPICDGNCINGICASDPLSEKNKCVCYEGFQGPNCETVAIIIFDNKNPALVPLLAVFIVAFIVIILMITLKYKGIVFMEYKTSFVDQENEL